MASAPLQPPFHLSNSWAFGLEFDDMDKIALAVTPYPPPRLQFSPSPAKVFESGAWANLGIEI